MYRMRENALLCTHPDCRRLARVRLLATGPRDCGRWATVGQFCAEHVPARIGADDRVTLAWVKLPAPRVAAAA